MIPWLVSVSYEVRRLLELATPTQRGIERGDDVVATVLALVIGCHSAMVHRLSITSKAKVRVNGGYELPTPPKPVGLFLLFTVARWSATLRLKPNLALVI